MLVHVIQFDYIFFKCGYCYGQILIVCDCTLSRLELKALSEHIDVIEIYTSTYIMVVFILIYYLSNLFFEWYYL